jgi:hypothetical protein
MNGNFKEIEMEDGLSIKELNSAMIQFLATLDNTSDDEWWGTEQELCKGVLVKFREFLVLGQSDA